MSETVAIALSVAAVIGVALVQMHHYTKHWEQNIREMQIEVFELTQQRNALRKELRDANP